MISREGDVNGMDREYVQCQECGCVHQVDIQFKTEELFVRLWCPKCRDGTTHLLCGDKEEDLYATYNLNIDPKYY